MRERVVLNRIGLMSSSSVPSSLGCYSSGGQKTITSGSI